MFTNLAISTVHKLKDLGQRAERGTSVQRQDNFIILRIIYIIL